VPAGAPSAAPTPPASSGGEMADAPARRADAPVFVPRPREQAKAPVVASDAPVVPAPASPPAVAGVPPAAGPELLDRVRPLMRRNRRGPGGSGSVPFLARGLRCSEADLMAGFLALGLGLEPGTTGEPLNVEIGDYVWWLNRDSNGGVWINGREQGPGDVPAPAGQATEAAASAPAAPTPEIMAPVAAIPPPPSPENVLSGVRLLLKETKTGGFAGKLDRVAEDLKKSPDDLLAALLGAGLKGPEKAREKPVFVEHAGEIFWLNKNAKDELWVNAKASKFTAKAEAEGDEAGAGEKKGSARRPRPKKQAE